MSQVPWITTTVLANSLERLNLAGNYLPSVGIFGLDMFPNMTKLRHLILRRCSIHTITPESIQSLGHLKYLNLAENQLRTVPSVLRTLTSLEHLDFSYQCTLLPCDITGKFSNITFTLTNTSFSGMNNLRRLDVRGLRGPLQADSLVSVPNLEELDISSITLTEIDARAFEATPLLRRLTCTQCWILEPTPAPAWTSLSNLTYLDFSYSPSAIIPANLSHSPLLISTFPNLRVLNLTCSLVSDHTLCDEYLYQYEAPMNPTLLMSMEKLEVLHLGKNGLTSWSERWFKKNPRLKRLHIEFNKFRSLTEAMLEDFARLFSDTSAILKLILLSFRLEYLDLRSRNKSEEHLLLCTMEVVTFYFWVEGNSNITVEGWDGGEGYFCDQDPKHIVMR